MLSKTLKGSTLIETLVSLVILLTILSIFLLNINKVNQSLNPYSIYQAYEVSEDILNTIDTSGPALQKIELGRFVIESTIEILINNELYKIVIEVYDSSHHLLYIKKKIISTTINLS